MSVHDPAEPLDRRDGLLATIVAVVAVLVFLPIAYRWFSLLDEGYVLAIADQVNHGRVLYRDVWIDNPFPGAFIVLAEWFRIAGTSIASSRHLALVGFAVYAAASFLVARAVLGRRAALGFVVFLCVWRLWAFPHWQIFGYSLPAAVAVALATVTAIAAERRRSLLGWLAAGVLLGVATLCKQTYGFAVAATTMVALLIIPFLAGTGRPRARDVVLPPLLLGLGLAAALLPVLLSLAAHGAFDDFVRQAVLQPLRGASAFQAYVRLPALWPLHRQDPALRAAIGSYFPAIVATVWWPSISASWAWRETPVWDATLKLVYWAPILAVAAAGIVGGASAVGALMRRQPSRAHGPRLLVFAVAAGYLLAFPPPRDWTHLMMVVPPAALLGAMLLRALAIRLPRFAGRALVVGAWVALVALVVVSVLLARDLRRQNDFDLALPRAGVSTDEHNGPLLRDVLARIEEVVPKDAALPVYPLQPMIGFLSAREPVGGFHVIWPVQDPGRDDRIIADLERLRPPLVVYSLSQYAHLGRFQDNASRLYAYLVEHYAIERVFSREVYGSLLTTLARRPEGGRDGTPLGDFDGARRVRWPFAEVVAVMVGAPESATPATVRLAVPAAGGKLVFAYGVDPDRWLGLSAGPFRFVMSARAGEGEWRTLLDAAIDPGHDVADRHWHDATVDLTPFAGADIEVRFAVTVSDPVEHPDDLAGFADLRFVPAPPS